MNPHHIPATDDIFCRVRVRYLFISFVIWINTVNLHIFMRCDWHTHTHTSWRAAQIFSGFSIWHFLGIPVLAEEFSVFGEKFLVLAEKFSVLAEEFFGFWPPFLKSVGQPLAGRCYKKWSKRASARFWVEKPFLKTASSKKNAVITSCEITIPSHQS